MVNSDGEVFIESDEDNKSIWMHDPLIGVGGRSLDDQPEKLRIALYLACEVAQLDRPYRAQMIARLSENDEIDEVNRSGWIDTQTWLPATKMQARKQLKETPNMTEAEWRVWAYHHHEVYHIIEKVIERKKSDDKST